MVERGTTRTAFSLRALLEVDPPGMRGRSFWGQDGWSSSKVREDAIFCSVFRARAHLARDPPNVTAAGPGLETVTSIEIEDQRHARLEGSLEERRQFGRLS